MNARRYFREFLEMSKGGVFAFQNDRHKSVYVCHTNDILRSIGDIVPQIRNGTHKSVKMCRQSKYLKLVILETVEDSLTRRLRYEHWCNEYRKKGYKFYLYKKALEYRVVVDIDKDFNKDCTNSLVYVKLESRRQATITVGVFENMEEAKEFVESVYRPMEQVIPIYARNSLSIEYFKLGKSDDNL